MAEHQNEQVYTAVISRFEVPVAPDLSALRRSVAVAAPPVPGPTSNKPVFAHPPRPFKPLERGYEDGAGAVDWRNNINKCYFASAPTGFPDFKRQDGLATNWVP